MKRTLKILSVSLLMIIFMSVSVFAEELKQIDEYEGHSAEEFSAVLQQKLEGVYTEETDFEYLIEYYSEIPAMVDGINAIKEVMAGGETIEGYETYGLYEAESGNIFGYQLVEFSENYYLFSIEFDTDLNFVGLNLEKVSTFKPGDEIPETFDLADFSSSENNASSLQFVFDKEALGNAAVNTIIGLGVVFGALIFISLIISLFKYISPEGRNFKAAPVAPVKENVVKKEAVKEVSNSDNELVAAITAAVVTDETQLVAAITAAISAYEGVSSDSFVVRTIKKRKW